MQDSEPAPAAGEGAVASNGGITASKDEKLKGSSAAPVEVIEVEAKLLYTEDCDLIGKRVESFWRSEQQWFAGTVTAAVDPEHYPCLNLTYDDGDTEDVLFTGNFTRIISQEKDTKGAESAIRWLEGVKPVWAPGSDSPTALAEGQRIAANQAKLQKKLQKRKRPAVLGGDEDGSDGDVEAGNADLDAGGSGGSNKRRNLGPSGSRAKKPPAAAARAAGAPAGAASTKAGRPKGRLRKNPAAAAGTPATSKKQRKQQQPLQQPGKGRVRDLNELATTQAADSTPLHPAASSSSSSSSSSSESSSSSSKSSSSSSESGSDMDGEQRQPRKKQRPTGAPKAAAGSSQADGRQQQQQQRKPAAGGATAAAANGPLRQPSPARPQQQQQQQKLKPPTGEQLRSAAEQVAAKTQRLQGARPKTVMLDQRQPAAASSAGKAAGSRLQQQQQQQEGSGVAAAAAAAGGGQAAIKRASSSGAILAGKSPANIAGKSPADSLKSPPIQTPAAAVAAAGDAAGGGVGAAAAAASAKVMQLNALLGGTAAAAAAVPAAAGSGALQKASCGPSVSSLAKPRLSQQLSQQVVLPQAVLHPDHQQQKDKDSAAGGSAAVALATAYANKIAAGAAATGGAVVLSAAAANAAQRRKAEEEWIRVLQEMPVSGKGIKNVGSKALEMCNAIGPQRVVRAILDQMTQLPAGPARVNLLYLVDSTLKQASKVPASQQSQQLVDLPSKVSAGLTTMVTNAVYDLESLKKVRHLLDLWCQQGRVISSYAKMAYQQMAVFEKQKVAEARAAAEKAASGVPDGLQVQRVILPVYETVDKEAAAVVVKTEQGDTNLLQQQQQQLATPAAAAGAVGVRDPRARQQQQQQQQEEKLESLAAPDSPTDALLGQLEVEIESELGWDQGPASGDTKQQQQQQQLWLEYRNLFGPEVASGFILDQYSTLNGFRQPPFSAALAELAHCKQQQQKPRVNIVLRGLLAKLRQRNLQLQLAPDIMSARDMDWAAEADLSEKRVGTWKEVLQPIDEAKARAAAAAAAAGGDAAAAAAATAVKSEGPPQQKELADWDAVLDKTEAVSGGSEGADEYSTPTWAPSAPKREEGAGYGGGSYNNGGAMGLLGLSSQADSGGFTFSTAAQGFEAMGMGGPLGLVTASLNPALSQGLGGAGGVGGLGQGLGPQGSLQQNMVAAAMYAAQSLGVALPQQQQQQPSWASQMDELMREQLQQQQQQQQQEGNPPPLPPDEPANQQRQQQPQQQQQQQQAKRFVVPGAADDDDSDFEDMYGGPPRAKPSFMADDGDDDGDDQFPPPLPAGPPPEPADSPQQPPLPPGPAPDETSPLYDPDDDDNAPPPLPADGDSPPPPLPAGGPPADFYNTGYNSSSYGAAGMDVSVTDGYGNAAGHSAGVGGGYYGQRAWQQQQQQQQQGLGMSFGMGMNATVGVGMNAGMNVNVAAGNMYGYGGMAQQQQYMQQQYMQQQQQMMTQQQLGGGGAATGGANAYWQQQQQQHYPGYQP